MKRLRDLAVEHKSAVALAILLSLLTAFPQVYFRYDHRDDGVYQGIEMLPDSPWSPRVREFQDGHGFGSIYYKDGKSDPYIFQPMGSAIVAYTGSAFGLDINNTLLLSRLVLPFVAFLLVYSFVLFLTADTLIAIASASVLLLADSLLNPSGVLRLLHGLSPSNSFLDLSNPVNPAMIYVPLFGFLAAFWVFYRKKEWWLGAISALILGLNFYNYFYTWTYLYAFGGILVLFFLLRKRWQEALRIGSVFLGALIVAIPYGFNLYRAIQYPTYADVAMRLGVMPSHASAFIGVIALGALILFIIGFPRADRERYFFGLALLLAPIITLNQQLITGKVMQPGHYHWYFHRPIAIIFVFGILGYWLTKLGWSWTKKALAVLIIIVGLGTAAYVQISSYYHDTDDGGAMAIERQKYGSPMAWFNALAAKDSVVLADEQASRVVVIYTPLDVYYHRGALYSLAATNERLRNVFFTFYRLEGVGAGDVRQRFFADRDLLSWNFYGIYYRELLGSHGEFPDSKVEELTAAYQATLSTPAPVWLEQMFQKYDVSYVLWDMKANPAWRLDRYPFLRREAVFGDLAIYHVVP